MAVNRHGPDPRIPQTLLHHDIRFRIGVVVLPPHVGFGRVLATHHRTNGLARVR